MATFSARSMDDAEQSFDPPQIVIFTQAMFCFLFASRSCLSPGWQKVLRSGTSAIKESQVTTANFCFSIPFSLKYQQNRPRLHTYPRHLLKAFFQTRYHDGSDVLAGSVDRERWYHLAIATTIAS